MMPTIPSLRLDPIKYLVNKKYPGNTLGKEERIILPGDKYRFELESSKQEIIKQVNEQAKAYAEALKSKSAEELGKLVKLEQDKAEKERTLKEKEQEEARFYNLPEAKADFEYWSKHDYWTPDQATVLLLGKDPRKVDYKRLKTYGRFSPFVEELMEVRELVDKAIKSGRLQYNCKPSDFIKWAQEKSFKVPSKLNKLVEKYADPEGSLLTLGKLKGELLEKEKTISCLEQRLAEVEALKKEHKDERESKEKIIAGLLCCLYGAASLNDDKLSGMELSDDILRSSGIEIHPDTAKKYYRMSLRHIDKSLDDEN